MWHEVHEGAVKGSPQVLRDRSGFRSVSLQAIETWRAVSQRTGHFMKRSMLDGQLATLERYASALPLARG
jgi:gluconate kinase